MDDAIPTPRLELLPLTPSLLRAVVNGDLREVERRLDASVAAAWEEGVPAARRQGFARESVHALLDWAWATGCARTCVASVSPDNAPSLALVQAFGFRQVGEQIDEIDGLEGCSRGRCRWRTERRGVAHLLAERLSSRSPSGVRR